MSLPSAIRSFHTIGAGSAIVENTARVRKRECIRVWGITISERKNPTPYFINRTTFSTWYSSTNLFSRTVALQKNDTPRDTAGFHAFPLKFLRVWQSFPLSPYYGWSQPFENPYFCIYLVTGQNRIFAFLLAIAEVIRIVSSNGILRLDPIGYAEYSKSRLHIQKNLTRSGIIQIKNPQELQNTHTHIRWASTRDRDTSQFINHLDKLSLHKYFEV